MTRVKRGVKKNASHKKILKQAKGYYSSRSRTYRLARQAVIKSQQYAYRDRKQRKREFRRLWVARINAAAREHGLSYSRLMHGLRRASAELNRKLLADLAVHDKAGFRQLVEKAKTALAQQQ